MRLSGSCGLGAEIDAMRDAREIDLRADGPYAPDAADRPFRQRHGKARVVAIVDALPVSRRARAPPPLASACLPSLAEVVITCSRIVSAQITCPPSRARP